MVATAAYLEEWLDNDKNAAQSIYGFAVAPYQGREEYRENKPKYADDGKRSSLRRGEYVFSDMQELRYSQAVKEGTAPDSPLYKYEDAGNQYGFTALNFIDLYSKRYMTLYELLTLRKEVMQITSKKKVDEPIRDGFRDLSSIFENASHMDDKKYVIATLQIWKLECAYRFALAAEIAQFASENHIAEKDILEVIKSRKSKACWGRYDVPRWLTLRDRMQMKCRVMLMIF